MSETATETEQPRVDTTPGTFAWNELATSDLAGSEGFYASLFGWAMESIPGMDYKMAMVGDRPVAGLMDKSEHCDGPPLWISYVYVDDVRTSLAKAVELGAEMFKDVTEVPGKGSFALIQDPQGGKLGLWQAA
jgi:predicted enzyme related to lactoylglutathione lyase